MNGPSPLAAVALAALPAVSGVFWDPGLARNPLCNDGNAEVSFYESLLPAAAAR